MPDAFSGLSAVRGPMSMLGSPDGGFEAQTRSWFGAVAVSRFLLLLLLRPCSLCEPM